MSEKSDNIGFFIRTGGSYCNGFNGFPGSPGHPLSFHAYLFFIVFK